MWTALSNRERSDTGASSESTGTGFDLGGLKRILEQATNSGKALAVRRVAIPLFAAAATAILLLPLWPFLTADFWPTFGDMGGHSVPMRQWGSWLAEGRTIGWDHSWFGGYPIYQFYFPGGWFLWKLFDVGLPEVAAYRLMAVSVIPALVLVVWWLGRTWGLSIPRAGIVAACVSVGFAVSLTGATSVAAGLYAHHWAVVFGLLYLGALNKTADRRWGWWPLVGFLSLAAAFLCHPYPAVLIGAASFFMLPRVGWRTFAKGLLLAAGLTAWWWLPFAAQVEMAYIDMKRWPPSWSEILLPNMLVRLYGAVSGSDVYRYVSDHGVVVSLLAALGSAAVLVLAGVGAYRLGRKVPDRRVLYPLAALVVLPLVNKLAVTINAAGGVSEMFGFQGGRLFFVWFTAVPSLAAFAVVDLAAANPKLRSLPNGPSAAGVSLSLVAVAALLLTSLSPVAEFLSQNVSTRLNVAPASADAAVETSTWFSSTRWVANESGSAAFYAPAANAGRSVGGLQRESSPTARFRSAMPLPDWVRLWAWSRLTDVNVPAPVATRTVWPVPQLQSLGVDMMWTPPERTLTRLAHLLEPVTSGFDLVAVPPQPAHWPLHWIPPATTPYRDFLEQSLHLFGSWEASDDVTIPVWGTPPNRHANDVAATANVDWSDDRFVRFHADRPGMYYATASWHPNWTLMSGGAGPWPAGPNQMVVWADKPGLVEMAWGKHWSESVGQAVSAVTPAVMIVASLPVLRLRRRFAP